MVSSHSVSLRLPSTIGLNLLMIETMLGGVMVSWCDAQWSDVWSVGAMVTYNDRATNF